VIVLILVAVLWIAVLVPSVISKLSERRSAGSIDHFHSQLDLLERTGPKLVSPAYRLTGTDSVGTSSDPIVVAAPPPALRPNLTLVPTADDTALVPDAPEDEPSARADDFVRQLYPSDAVVSEPEISAFALAAQEKLVARDRRQIARRRRRDVFGALCALAAATGLLGLVRPLRAAWVATAVFMVLLVAFVAMAVYGQRLEAERRHMRELRRTQDAYDRDADVDSGVGKYLSEDELAQYYEAEDARLAAQA
jgi:hypothetical protein